MENLSLVAAIGRSGELGNRNHLIWKIREDLTFYRKLTYHENIIMGRKTFESMPPSALQGRNVFILTSTSLDKYYDINSYNNFNDLIKYIKMTSEQNFIVVGGAQIYELFLPYVDTMYITEIDDNAEADTFFPYYDVRDWDIRTIYKHYPDDDNNSVFYIRNEYVRKRVR